jgi:hypothetical protein
VFGNVDDGGTMTIARIIDVLEHTIGCGKFHIKKVQDWQSILHKEGEDSNAFLLIKCILRRKRNQPPEGAYNAHICYNLVDDKTLMDDKADDLFTHTICVVPKGGYFVDNELRERGWEGRLVLFPMKRWLPFQEKSKKNASPNPLHKSSYIKRIDLVYKIVSNKKDMGESE